MVDDAFMSEEEKYDRYRDESAPDREAEARSNEPEEVLLPTISLVHVPHPKIPNLYQCCYEYVEPWQWSSETELVETGRWFLGPAKDD